MLLYSLESNFITVMIKILLLLNDNEQFQEWLENKCYSNKTDRIEGQARSQCGNFVKGQSVFSAFS